jgi:hypothetical protein
MLAPPSKLDKRQRCSRGLLKEWFAYDEIGSAWGVAIEGGVGALGAECSMYLATVARAAA